MNFQNDILKNEERAIFALRSLYERYGYSQYKMSKFEEYDLYVRNKDFLISDSVITFTDTNGKLMALKPDVTLSIIKNGKDGDGEIQKLYYNENVYRVSKGAQGFKEIVQVGLECIGKLDGYCVAEVVTLAAKSLLELSDKCVLDISHMGIVSALTSKLPVSDTVRRSIIACIGEKNPHELSKLCDENGVSQETAEKLRRLIGLYGSADEVLPKLREICDIPEVTELADLCSVLSESGLGEMLRIDFSVVSDIDYYNGIAFKGFIEGVPGSVISGGRYDGLMEKMGRKESAIGFAVYLDMLEHFYENNKIYDVDTVLLYENGESVELISAAARKFSENGSVCVLRSVPDKLRYKRLARLTKGEVVLLENNA